MKDIVRTIARCRAIDLRKRFQTLLYLLDHSAASVESVARTPGEDAECAVSRALDGERVVGFGASDCDCGSHLVYSARRDPLLRSVASAYGTDES